MTLDAGLEPLDVLFNFDSCTCIRKLLSNGFGFFLRNAFFDRLRSRFDQVLGFLQAQGRDLAHDFDDVDLVAANGLENDVKFRLLFCGPQLRCPLLTAAGATAAAAAETPNVSSNCLTSSEASRSVMLFKYSITSSRVAAMIFSILLKGS